METLGGLLVVAGSLVVAYALFRKFKKKDLAGKAFWQALGVGLLLLFVGTAIAPDEEGGGSGQAASGGKDPLGELANLPLASREQEGQLTPSPIGATLGDVRRKLASLAYCREKINGRRITLTGRADHGSLLDVSFSVEDLGIEGKAAVIERLRLELCEDGVLKSKTFDSAKAHVVLIDLLRQ